MPLAPSQGNVVVYVPTGLDGILQSPIPRSAVEKISLHARSMTDLRNLVTVQALLPSAFRIEVLISRLPEWSLAPIPRVGDEPYWKTLRTLCISGDDHAWRIEASFASAVPSGQFLCAIARRTPGIPLGNSANPLIGATARDVMLWRPGDPSVTLLEDGEPGSGYQVRFERSPERDISVTHSLVRIPNREIPPVDEITVNPIGFTRFPTEPIGLLTAAGGEVEVLRASGGTVRLPRSGTVADIDVMRLRPLAGVRLSPSLLDAPDPNAVRRTIVSLAAAGIPLTLESGSPGWQAVIEPPLLELIRAAGEPSPPDPITREVHSIRLRRWALHNYSASGFWRRVARAAGFPVASPQVSVVLPTRRPERLPSALRQIGRQRGVDLEVIVALHGHDRTDPDVVAALAAAEQPVRTIEIDARRAFDDVLNIAVAQSSGTYIARMDDDDWYGPEHLSDLVLAHLYSGAELTGCLAEFVYLEEIDTTVRRRHETEVYPLAAENDPLVGGGALLVPRYILESVGGFKAVPLEDLQLGHSITAAGGRVYRHHGLNYLYCRRDPRDHLWKADYDKLLKRNLAVWPRLFTNPLLEDPCP